MADTLAEIPEREWFKASEVCEIASVQPYVLRSWELEFPSLGMARAAGGSRTYRRSDVERVLRIKQLVFVEGLTLAGARRRIEEDEGPPADEAPPPVIDDETRQKLDAVKRDLRALLEVLDGRSSATARPGWPPHPPSTLLEFVDGVENGNGQQPAGKMRRPRRS